MRTFRFSKVVFTPLTAQGQDGLDPDGFPNTEAFRLWDGQPDRGKVVSANAGSPTVLQFIR